MVVVGITDTDVFTADGIRRLESLRRQLEQLPGVDGVLCPTNARLVYLDDEDTLQIRPAADPLPSSDEQARRLAERLLSQPAYRSVIVHPSGRAVMCMVMVKASTRESDVAGRVIELADDAKRNQGFQIHVTGRAAATYWARILMGRDMGMLTGIALVVMILLLAGLFRSWRGVVLPLVIVSAAVLWSLGLMGYLGVPLSHSTEVLPILLIAMGVADSIHILKTYYALGREGGPVENTVARTMTELNRPVVLTSVTTAAGFLALNTSGIESIMTLGLFTAFGIMVALLFSVAFMPAALSLLGPPASGRKKGSGRFVALERVAEGYARLLTGHRKKVLLFILVVVLAAGWGATSVPVEMSNLDNFPKGHRFRLDTEAVNRYFPALSTLMVIIEGGKPDAVKDPKILHAMEELEDFLRRQPHVGAVQSVTALVKQMHRVLHGDVPEQYRLPRDIEIEQEKITGEDGSVRVRRFEVQGRQLVAQYFQLLEMSGKPDELSHMVTYDYSTARINVMLDTDRSSLLDPLTKKVREFLSRELGTLKAELTGMSELIRAVNRMVITGQGWSILTSLVLVWLVTSALFRSVVLGAFATLPLFFSLFLNFGVMGLGGIALNVMTMATSSVAVGVGIDYAIHFIHRFQMERTRPSGWEEATIRSMRTSGVAVSLNALVVAAGFGVLMASSFGGVAQMGLLIALTMITSAFGALTVLPVLFVSLRPRALDGGNAKGGER
ncbi:MAG: RND family transporter [Deltaproteobacteria bacterium]|nr:MAG: RND family transporter [Deltaproteobacteria bacterium]